MPLENSGNRLAAAAQSVKAKNSYPIVATFGSDLAIRRRGLRRSSNLRWPQSPEEVDV